MSPIFINCDKCDEIRHEDYCQAVTMCRFCSIYVFYDDKTIGFKDGLYYCFDCVSPTDKLRLEADNLNNRDKWPICPICNEKLKKLKQTA